jgi:flagellar M-ring protein FliF
VWIVPDFISKFLRQIADFWKSMDKQQKTRLYVTSAIVIVAISAGAILLTRPNHITLLNNTDVKQIGEMSDILNENKIWNAVENNGTSIQINSPDNNKAQVVLAQQGYPKGGMTFEDAISMIGISTTESDKKHIWKEQQISDLEAKLMLIDNIESAGVSLAVPEQTIFTTGNEEKPKPTANVVVKLKQTLTQQQVQGIVAIVSKSVEGLDPKDISVVDTNANILNANSGDDAIALASSQEEMRSKKEKDFENKVREYFNVGQFDNFDTFRVVANVVLDFDKLKSQSKTLGVPDGMDGGAVLESDSLKENAQNGSASGVPGTDTNPGGSAAPTYQTGTGDNGTYTKDQESRKYGYNETMTENEKATGKLIPDQSSMAISLWYGKKVATADGLNDDFINQVKQAASTATGIPVTNISVNKYKLAQPEIVKKPITDQIKQYTTDYGFFLIMLILIIGLMMAV